MGKYRSALTDLRSAQKPAYGAPAYSRFVNRPAGRRLAALGYALGLSPNAMTGISGGFSIAGILVLCIFPPGTGPGVACSVLLAIGYAFDSADGQLARLTRTGGPGGEWLDHVADMGKTVLVHGAILISLARAGTSLGSWEVIAVVAFAAVSVVAFFGWLLSDLLQRASGRAVPHARDSGRAPLLRSLLRSPSDYGIFLWVFVLWATVAFWWGYGLLLVANAAILAAALPVWYRQAKEAGNELAA